MERLTGHEVQLKGQKTYYYEGGPKSGKLLIFIHGWPDLAETWKHQLLHFLDAGYHVVAPDMRGYGQSSGPSNKRAYALSVLVPELIELLHHLGSDKAIWVAHDWGCGVVNALAAHYPEACEGYALLSVPYRTVELGLDHELTLVNRDIYPEDEYPYGQFDYQKYYELEPEKSGQSLETHPEKITKIFYVRADPSEWGKPGMTAKITRDGGWFGGNPDLLPDLPLNATTLDQSLYDNLVKSHKTHGGFPPTAYYLNHDVNAEYVKQEKNGGVLEFPVLFIDARYDSVCSTTTTPKMGEGQKKLCKNLKEVYLESGHWVQLEKPKEVNAAIEGWLKEKF